MFCEKGPNKNHQTPSNKRRENANEGAVFTHTTPGDEAAYARVAANDTDIELAPIRIPLLQSNSHANKGGWSAASLSSIRSTHVTSSRVVQTRIGSCKAEI
jgi:hypothetical protein